MGGGVKNMGTITERMGTMAIGGRRGYDTPWQRSRHDPRISVSGHYSALNNFLGILQKIFNMF